MSTWASGKTSTAIADVAYQSAGGSAFLLPIVYTTPEKRFEPATSFGVYLKWITTFKIDPVDWMANSVITLAVTGEYSSTYTKTSNGYYYNAANNSRLEFDGVGSWLFSWNGAGIDQTVATNLTADPHSLVGAAWQYITITVAVIENLPRLRDTLVDGDGNTWTVCQDVDDPAYVAGLYRLVCDRLVIDSTLQATLQYQQASCAGASDEGSRTVTWTNTGSPIAGAIQPFTADLGEMFGTVDFEDHFLIYLQTDPSGTGVTAMQPGDRFQDAGGVQYEIQAVLERNSLDELPVFQCVKKL